MKLKICFNNETHRISKPPDTFETLSQLISSIFLSKLPSNWILEYIDSDGDKVMLADEQDYRELMASNLDHSSATTAVKVFITSKLPGEEVQIPSVEVIDDLKQESEEDLQQIEERVDDRLFKLETLSVSMLDELLKASPLEEDVESNPEINMEVKKDEEIEKIILDPVMAPSLQIEDPITSLAADFCKYLQKPTLNFENKPDLNPSKKKDKSKKKQKKGWKKPKKAKLVPPPAKQNLLFLQDLSDKENREPVSRESKDMESMINRAIEKQVPRIAKMIQDYLAAENQKNDQKVYHHGINCGKCFTTPIIGVRYKCSICSNFDFCEKCEQTTGHPHAFIKIKTPDQPYSHPSVLNHFMPHPPMLMPFPQGFMPPPPFMHPPPFNPNQGPPFRPPPMHCPRPGQMRPMPFPGQGEPMRFPLHSKPCFMEMPNSPSMNNSMIFQRQENDHIRQFLSPTNENMMPSEPQEKQEIKVSIDLMESLNAMVQVEKEQEIRSEEIKNEIVEMPTIVIESNDECKKPLPMPKKFYSKTTRAKAKHLKQLLPDVDKEELLRFIHESPKELDLLELLENFQH